MITPQIQPIQKPRILVAINSLVSTSHPAYSNHIQLFYRLGRDYTEYDFILFNPSRMAIDRMRNMAAKTALAADCKYLLFLDDDVLVPTNFLKGLIASDCEIAAGHVIIRGYPFANMFFKYTEGKKELLSMPEKDVPEEDIFPVDAVGFSLALIKVELLKNLPGPFFITGTTNTEDIYFCLKAVSHFPETKIKVNQSIVCAHILWHEVISKNNRDEYMKYYLSQNPDQAPVDDPKPEFQDRGQEYFDKLSKAKEKAGDLIFDSEETLA